MNETAGLKERMLDFADEKNLFGTDDTLIAAVSGGVDSMVLLHLIRAAGIKLVVAHCNFGLRGEDSDADEQLVRKTAELLNVRLEVRKFDTTAYAEAKGLSIQLAARELRYHWFEELLHDHRAGAIATAHHLNDSIETFFINLVRGTGVQGLTGIPVKYDRVVRPLLFATREEVETYARQNNIEWREDASNESDKYRRNQIRHHLVPLLRQLNPSIEATMQQNMERMQEVTRMYRQAVVRLRNDIVHFDENSGCFRISMLELAGRQLSPELFYEVVKEYDFNPAQAGDMLNACMTQPGKMFYSPTHEALIDRLDILIRERLADDPQVYHIYSESEFLTVAIPFLSFEIRPAVDEFSTDPSTAFIGISQLTYPVVVRKWQEGDTLVPLGMKGRKKVSDLLTDIKMSRLDKEEVYIMESGGEIVWVAGIRLSDRFKITPATTGVLVAKKY